MCSSTNKTYGRRKYHHISHQFTVEDDLWKKANRRTISNVENFLKKDNDFNYLDSDDGSYKNNDVSVKSRNFSEIPSSSCYKDKNINTLNHFSNLKSPPSTFKPALHESNKKSLLNKPPEVNDSFIDSDSILNSDFDSVIQLKNYEGGSIKSNNNSDCESFDFSGNESSDTITIANSRLAQQNNIDYNIAHAVSVTMFNKPELVEVKEEENTQSKNTIIPQLQCPDHKPSRSIGNVSIASLPTENSTYSLCNDIGSIPKSTNERIKSVIIQENVADDITVPYLFRYEEGSSIDNKNKTISKRKSNKNIQEKKPDTIKLVEKSYSNIPSQNFTRSPLRNVHSDTIINTTKELEKNRNNIPVKSKVNKIFISSPIAQKHDKENDSSCIDVSKKANINITEIQNKTLRSRISSLSLNKTNSNSSYDMPPPTRRQTDLSNSSTNSTPSSLKRYNSKSNGISLRPLLEKLSFSSAKKHNRKSSKSSLPPPSSPSSISFSGTSVHSTDSSINFSPIRNTKSFQINSHSSITNSVSSPLSPATSLFRNSSLSISHRKSLSTTSLQGLLSLFPLCSYSSVVDFTAYVENVQGNWHVRKLSEASFSEVFILQSNQHVQVKSNSSSLSSNASASTRSSSSVASTTSSKLSTSKNYPHKFRNRLGSSESVQNACSTKRANQVMKIIPFGKVEFGQPTAKEISHEIRIAKAMSEEKGFMQVTDVVIVCGKYPRILLQLWDEYEMARGSENERPDIYTSDQHYCILSTKFAGTDLEKFDIGNWQEASCIFWKLVGILAGAENKAEFEHRDLHWGNVVIDVDNTSKDDGQEYYGNQSRNSNTTSYAPSLSSSNCTGGSDADSNNPDSIDLLCNTLQEKLALTVKQKRIGRGKKMNAGIEPARRLNITIIDYTLSRAKCKINGTLGIEYTALSDKELFEGKGDYQYDIYRFMKKLVKETSEENYGKLYKKNTTNSINLNTSGNCITGEDKLDDDNELDWADYYPKTNLLWLHYICDKLLHGKGLVPPKPVQRRGGKMTSMSMLSPNSESGAYNSLETVFRVINSRRKKFNDSVDVSSSSSTSSFKNGIEDNRMYKTRSCNSETKSGMRPISSNEGSNGRVGYNKSKNFNEIYSGTNSSEDMQFSDFGSTAEFLHWARSENLVPRMV